MDLVVNKLYRLSPIMDDPKLKKRVVQFMGYKERHFDIRRAVVRLLESGGELGEEYLVAPGLLINL